MPPKAFATNRRPERGQGGDVEKANERDADRPATSQGTLREEQVRDRRELELIALARELGSVTEACRRCGVDRSTYYRAVKRKRDEDGARARSPLAKPVSLENKILGLCAEYPEWGCDRLAWYLTLKGDAVSSPTVQKILIRHGLGKVAERRALASRLEEEGIKPSFAVP